MKTTLLFIAALLFLTGTLTAQNKQGSLKFSSINNVGLITGESQTIFTMQSINGIKFKSWLAGLGAAYDTYGYRSIPAFIDIRKKFGNKSWQPFIYGDAGINFPLYSADLPRKQNGNDAYKFYNSFYGEAGLGISRSISHGTTFNLSAGFSYKHFSYLQYTYYNYLNVFPLTSAANSQFDFYYRRLSIKMGISF